MIVAYVYNNNPKSKYFRQIGYCHLTELKWLRLENVYIVYKDRRAVYTNAESFAIIKTVEVGNQILYCDIPYTVVSMRDTKTFSVTNEYGQRKSIPFIALISENMVIME